MASPEMGIFSGRCTVKNIFYNLDNILIYSQRGEKKVHILNLFVLATPTYY